ncbi:hypothetical protein CPC08DRAFT_640114 [Agrocybe pediades]|nr:hypothetical protein CPC08DRAFT_640114 [Agrocybe pediades]
MKTLILSTLACHLLSSAFSAATSRINRHEIVSHFNPSRNASNPTTPMQIGNGNFAFGADITGLQTFLPWAILSSWGWKNDSFPEGITQADIDAYRGETLDNHGRQVQYEFGGPEPIQQWLISNPNRVNLGRVGLVFLDGEGHVMNVTEEELQNRRQVLDLWNGIITSTFEFAGEQVTVQTACSQEDDVIGVKLDSSLIGKGKLALFVDFPWNDGSQKFSAPFVGSFAPNTTSLHKTTLNRDKIQAEMEHTLVNSTFFTSIAGDPFSIHRDSPSAHRYTISPSSASSSFSVNVAFGKSTRTSMPSVDDTFSSSETTWSAYWSNSGFVDVMTGSTDDRAEELQRRIILSRYLMRVNEAGDLPPQESGLVNNGWVDFQRKFHMEMYFWHSLHFALYSNLDLLSRSSSHIYADFLSSSIARAQKQQGWPAGARWPKMTDPQGRMAPGEINELLIWEQVHPIVFAEYIYRATEGEKEKKEVLQEWREIIKQTADWMAAFAWFNETTGLYDLGPPMYVVSEDTDPVVTRNPAFELAYWRLGLDMAETWMERLGLEAKEFQNTTKAWKVVKEHLAPLPMSDDAKTYVVYEGIEENFWTDPKYTSDHPALVGLYGWLPEIQGVDRQIANQTMAKVWEAWNETDFWGWDFGMLAMAAARQNMAEKALDWLLHPLFEFDDVGMPGGGVKVPTPYFPGSGSLLLAVAMMAEGWDDCCASESATAAPGFPAEGWAVKTEGLLRVL